MDFFKPPIGIFSNEKLQHPQKFIAMFCNETFLDPTL
jgi:hypothetical protein